MDKGWAKVFAFFTVCMILMLGVIIFAIGFIGLIMMIVRMLIFLIICGGAWYVIYKIIYFFGKDKDG
jgi:hypothetical protein